jgi:aminoglycoside phosphotransferase (APT) family kinase protein
MCPAASLPNSARSLSEGLLGVHTKIVPIPGGQHATYHLSGSREAVLKIMPPSLREAWAREVAALGLFGAEVPVPELLGAHADGDGCYLLTSYVPAQALSRVLADGGFPSSRALCNAARAAGSIHRVARAKARYLPHCFVTDDLVQLGLGTPSFYESWASRVRSAELRLGLERIDAILRAVRENLACIEGIESTVQLVHGDYQARNLLFGPAGRLEAVVDWELARYAPALNDIATLLRFSVTDSDELPILESYGDPNALPREPRRAARCYDLIKVAFGVSKHASESPDLPAWLAFIDGCIAFLAEGDATLVRQAAWRLREI